MERIELKKYLNEEIISKGQRKKVCSKKLESNEEAFIKLKEYTSWIAPLREFNTNDLVWIFLTDLKENPKCPVCKKIIHFPKYATSFPKTCSNICGRNFHGQKQLSQTKKNLEKKVSFTNREELEEVIEKLFRKKNNILNTYSLDNYPSIKEGILKYTSFLKEDLSMKQRIHILLDG